MSLILFIVVVIVLLALAIYGLQLMPLIGSPFKELLMILAVAIAIIAIARRSGML